jgi:mono/diheme cytochrome c family protein
MLMNHRNLPSRNHLLWLAAVTTLIILAVLLTRPSAWAGQSATHLQPAQLVQDEADSPQLVASASDSDSGATHITLQADVPASDNCIACHTDKKKLKAVAEEPEEVKSEEASGEG